MGRWITFLAFSLWGVCAFGETQEYRIGAIVPLSGNLANYGRVVREAIEGVHVPGVRWVFEDEVCEATRAVAAFKKLKEVDGIRFFVGPTCGSPQKALAPLAKVSKSLVVLPNAAPLGVIQTSQGQMLSVQYSVDEEAAFLAEQMNRRGLKRAAMIGMDNDFSRIMEKNFLAHFHGEVVYSFFAASGDSQLMKSVALKLKNLEFDSIFLADIGPLFAGLLTELRKLGIPVRPTFTNYGAQMPDILQIEGAQAEGLLYSYPDVPDSEDAFGYFPRLAATMLAQAVRECRADYECVMKSFQANPSFRPDGTLAGGLILKTIHNGRYERLDP